MRVTPSLSCGTTDELKGGRPPTLSHSTSIGQQPSSPRLRGSILSTRCAGRVHQLVPTSQKGAGATQDATSLISSASPSDRPTRSSTWSFSPAISATCPEANTTISPLRWPVHADTSSATATSSHNARPFGSLPEPYGLRPLPELTAPTGAAAKPAPDRTPQGYGSARRAQQRRAARRGVNSTSSRAKRGTASGRCQSPRP